METLTRPSGPKHTRVRGLGKFVWLSLLLHLPFTPLLGLLGWFSLLKQPEPVPDLGEIRGIPVELLDTDPGAERAASATPEAEPTAAPEAPSEEDFRVQDAGAPKPKDASAEDAQSDAAVDADVDAGTDAEVDSGDAEADAGPDAGEEIADAAQADAGPDATGSDASDAVAASDAATGADAGDAEAGSALLDAGDAGGDPVALSGSAGAVADSNANVSAIIYTENIRSHSLGPRIGRILSSLYQWRDFFGPTGLDPIRDIDRILIAGPQFRDSSNIVVVLHHHIPKATLRAALDQLVKRDPEGAWLPAEVPVARARADRAARYFVLPNDHLVIVAPQSALSDALSKKKNVSLRAAGPNRVMVARLVLPWRAFEGMPFRIPHSIQWVNVTLETLPRGRVMLKLEAEEGSEASAVDTAALMDRSVASIASVDLGVFGAFLGQRQHRFLESSHFEAKGKKIVGTILATDAQVSAGLDLVDAWLAQIEGRSSTRRPPVPPPPTSPKVAPKKGPPATGAPSRPSAP